MKNGSNGKPIRVGVVGVGYVGHHHARIYSELPGVELVGVVDIDENRLQEFGSSSGACSSRAERVPNRGSVIHSGLPATWQRRSHSASVNTAMTHQRSSPRQG